jgi:HEAT repeat protein
VEVDEPAREGRIRCPKCGTEFGDYEEWVRLCRAAAFASIRPVPPTPEEPPPRPPRLNLIAGSLLAAAAIYVTVGFVAGPLGLTIACGALALFQVLAGLALLGNRRHADVLVRLAAGLSALVPLFMLPVVYFVGIFGFFSRPLVVKYFGGRVDPMPDRVRHPLIAWLLVVLAIVAGLFAAVVAGALETAARWNDPLPPVLELGSRLHRFFTDQWWWAPVGLLGGLCVLALWGKVNRHGFLVVSLLSLLGVVSLGAPPVVESWVYERSVREASTYLDEWNVQRLLWGITVADPKVRMASIRAMEAAGSRARVAAPGIVPALKDPDRRVRLAAACALAQFDPAVEGILPILIGALEDDRSVGEEKDRAALALGHLGARARPALTLLLDRLRAGDSATIALAELGPASIPGLTEALSDPGPAVRRRAARVLRMLGPAARSAVPALLERLKDPEADVRVEAAAALGEIHREKAVPALRALLTEDRSVAKAAAEMLCILGEKDGLSELSGGSSSLNMVRSRAICEHLTRTLVEKDLEGTGAEIILAAAEQAGMCADISIEGARLPAMTAFRRVHSAWRKRSILEVLRLFDVDYVLEPGVIRILAPEQAKSFWTGWWAEQPRR